MSFNQEELDRISYQTRGIFNVYAYQTGDTAADVQAPGYFERARFRETDGISWDRGIIRVIASDAEFWGRLCAGDNCSITVASGTDDFRASWKSTSGTIYQLLAATNTPQPIQFSHVTVESPLITYDLLAGEFESHVAANVVFSVSMQVIRQSPGGSSEWGFYLETEISPSIWIPVPDTLRVMTFKSAEVNDVEHIDYTVAASINNGDTFRLMQICSNHTKNIGLISGDHFGAAAPYSPGAIMSIEVKF